jgi:hypothetical protein
MELYTLDNLLRREEVIDDFESLIWSERWREIGDFEVVLQATNKMRSRFTLGRFLALNVSERVMRVKSVERTFQDGKDVLTVKGQSLESILDDRAFAIGPNSHQVVVIEDTPGNVARYMFDHICRPPGAINVRDEIPFLLPGDFGQLPTIPEHGDIIRWEQEPGSLYDAIREVCVRYNLGFRLLRNYDASELYFAIFTGVDRTTAQTTHAPVVFSVSEGTFMDTREFLSEMNYKNVAYIASQGGWSAALAPGTVPNPVSGFDRRVMQVNVEIPDDYVGSNTTYRMQAGYEELNKKRRTSLFDGEVSQYSGYIYGVHYGLGDFVEVRDDDGVVSRRRVFEQIFVSDESGDRSYPTLGSGQFMTDPTWLSISGDLTTWSESTTEVWANA